MKCDLIWKPAKTKKLVDVVVVVLDDNDDDGKEEHEEDDEKKNGCCKTKSMRSRRDREKFKEREE